MAKEPQGLMLLKLKLITQHSLPNSIQLPISQPFSNWPSISSVFRSFWRCTQSHILCNIWHSQ